jgi:hypothetical protein
MRVPRSEPGGRQDRTDSARTESRTVTPGRRRTATHTGRLIIPPTQPTPQPIVATGTTCWPTRALAHHSASTTCLQVVDRRRYFLLLCDCEHPVSSRATKIQKVPVAPPS